MHEIERENEGLTRQNKQFNNYKTARRWRILVGPALASLRSGTPTQIAAQRCGTPCGPLATKRPKASVLLLAPATAEAASALCGTRAIPHPNKALREIYRNTARTRSGTQPLHATQCAHSLWTDAAPQRKTTLNSLANLSTTRHMHAHMSTCP